MHPILRRLDLNLLPVFDAVYRHRSVRLAAVELSMSTSALSHALSRLREFLQDPLFFRDGHKMSPSVYACQLAPHIAQNLAALNHYLCPAEAFDPATSEVTFNIAVTDYTAFCVFPRLMQMLQHEAPGLSFELCHLPHNPALNELLAGEMDMALSFSEPGERGHPDLEETDLFSDEFVVVSDARRDSLTLEAYLAAGHLVVTPWNEKQGLLDTHLTRLGLKRKIAIRTPSMMGAPFIIADSPLLMAIPSYVASIFAPAAGLKIFKLPFAAPPFTVKIFSHRRSAKREPTEWIKAKIVSAFDGGLA